MTDPTPTTTTSADVLRLTEQMTLFRIDFRIWSGRKQLRAEDLHLGTKRPPEDLVSLGSKKVCNPEALRVFHRHKKQLERQLLAVGTRFLGGYLGARPPRRGPADECRDHQRRGASRCRALPHGLRPSHRCLVCGLSGLVRGDSQGGRSGRTGAPSVSLSGAGVRIESSPVVSADTLIDDLKDVGETIFTEVEQLARGLEHAFVGQAQLSRRRRWAAFGACTRSWTR